jgi:hypothetical protein
MWKPLDGKAAYQVLSRHDLGDDEPAAAFCAYILAALLDLDYHRAEKSSTRLVQQCEAKKFSKFESTLFGHWARAAAMIARCDNSVLNKQFQNIADVRRVHIDRGLARWKSGQPSELDGTDFWDWLTTALASIAQSFGYRFETNEFADHIWTRELN